ncbi:MAG TPA: sensor domain-containing diguanylate cyclase [Noviherbaspirillum sp.]|uniref:sensor domain-containing diguanylate cyclase n=1 Tax=Noviherbaspirillum sp. TaxID=1926288 RepID=UPI002D2695B7|nr:sensor domain-containing diguanylate cyclase [Noviherbaspirillum sp.]HYD95740.1 sensor domain-containing diguanylate cyclase [Noviherbaspirillum sp.]
MNAGSAVRAGSQAIALQPEADAQQADQPMLRIRRIGKTLFDVANCVIVLGNAPAPAAEGDGSMEAIETAFCHEVQVPNEAFAVTDTSRYKPFAAHRRVAGSPYIRFFASHPVCNMDKSVAGRICLLDYAPRAAFREGEKQLLADLAALVERELELRSLSASQLDLEKKNKNLRRKSLIDPLIGTWNRGAIMRILTIEAIRCDKAGVPLSLIVADLDYFKKINDTYGHPAGDAVLVKVASRLRSCIRPQEALGRYGGEEFLIVLPGSSHKTAMTVAERMRAAVASQPEVIGGATLHLTLSAGVASTDVFPTATTEELISRADMALYAAKDAGRNRVVNATPDLS